MTPNAIVTLVAWAVGLGVAWLTVPLIRHVVLRRASLHRERELHHHHEHNENTPIPRFGGVALAAGVLVVTLVAVLMNVCDLTDPVDLTILIGSLTMFGVGFWDDLRPLGAKKKLILQIIVATGVYLAGLQIDTFKNPINGVVHTLGPWSWVATVFWLVAFTNLINLIDGIDGLAGGISFMLMALLVYVGFPEMSFPVVLAAGAAGALLGFLRFNFPPARIYMGDGGAYFMGFLIGVLSIVSSQKGTVTAALLAPVFALALPIIDVSLALLRRFLKGLPLGRPDRRHIHHLLVGIGFSRRRTLLILYATSSVFLMLAVGVFWSQGRLLPLLFGVLCLTMLILGRTVGLVTSWRTMRDILGNTLRLRRQTRYAMALGEWFQLEAERCSSLEALWASYTFVLEKLEFQKVRLTLHEGHRVWELARPIEPELQSRQHTFVTSHAIEFSAPTKVSADVFEHVSELAAENWLKATSVWQRTSGLPLRFGEAPRPAAGDRRWQMGDRAVGAGNSEGASIGVGP